MTIPLFDLASRQAHWLAARQASVASNIANVNTPRYMSVDVEPFESVLKGKSKTLSVSNPSHMQTSSIAAGASGSGDVSSVSSGAAVNIENELLKEGEVHRAFELNTAIVKSFHRMIMSTVRS